MNIGATLGHIRDTRTMPRQEKHLITEKKEIPIILVPLITLQKNHSKISLNLCVDEVAQFYEMWRFLASDSFVADK